MRKAITNFTVWLGEERVWPRYLCARGAQKARKRIPLARAYRGLAHSEDRIFWASRILGPAHSAPCSWLPSRMRKPANFLALCSFSALRGALIYSWFIPGVNDKNHHIRNARMNRDKWQICYTPVRTNHRRRWGTSSADTRSTVLWYI